MFFIIAVLYLFIYKLYIDWCS